MHTIKIVNIINRIKSLPISSQKALGLGLVTVMIVALPVFMWALITQTFNPNKRAAVNVPSTYPIVIEESFTGNGDVNQIDWGWSGSTGSMASLENDTLKLTVTVGSDGSNGNSITTFPYIDTQIEYIYGDFNTQVDLMPIATGSGYSQLKFGSYTIDVRRVKTNDTDSIESWAGNTETGKLSTKLASVDLEPNTNVVQAKIKRVGSTITTYYNLGSGDIELSSMNFVPGSHGGEQFPHLNVENLSPEFLETVGYFDNYLASGNIISNTTNCFANDNKTIIVTDYYGTEGGTCHDIQEAIDAVSGEGYTIQINPGDYNITQTINIENKQNLTIRGNSGENIDSVWLSLDTTNGGGYGIKVTNSSGSIHNLHIEGVTPNGLLSINNSSNLSVYSTKLRGTNSHTLDVHNSDHITINDSEITSAAGAIEIGSSNNINILDNRIHDSDNAISIYSSSDVLIEKNLIYNNNKSGLSINCYLDSVSNITVVHNTFAFNNSGTEVADVEILGTNGSNLSFSNNIVYNSSSAGVRSTDGLSFYPFANNDIFGNNPNYLGIADQTGLSGNISSDPLLETYNDYFCLLDGSPAIYGDINNNEFMGRFGPCVTSSPAPSSSPSPAPIPGDANKDGRVNIVDVGIVVDNYKSSPPTDPRADLNNDNVVNIVDIGIIVDNYEL